MNLPHAAPFLSESSMPAYGPAHLVALAATAVVALVAVWVSRSIRGTGRERVWCAAVGWILLVAGVGRMLWDMLPAQWDLEQSLPLHLSDALRVVTAIALITRHGWAIAICYYWGLTLNLQSIVTPDLNYFHDPAIEYVLYWGFHIAALVTPIAFVWGLGYRPTWRGYGIACGAIALWAGAAGLVNGIAGTNYVYLAHAPAGPSALDLLGPWPVYIAWEAMLIAGAWALITWPWERRSLRGRPRLGRWGAVRRIDGAAAPPALGQLSAFGESDSAQSS